MRDEEFLKEVGGAIEQNKLYDWIAENYTRLTQTQLKELILNLDFAIYTEAPGKEINIEYKMLEELEERLK